MLMLLKSLFLGILQGLCEFLPVSSSGHLVLAQTMLGIDDGGLLFDCLLHVGTLVAVVTLFWRDIWALIRRPISKPVGILIVATIPAVICALLFNNFFDDVFAGRYLGLCFIANFAILMLGSRFSRGKREQVRYSDAVVMGLWQAVAILPGISRSGSTISGGSCMGLERRTAAKFSFIMSIPAILGSIVFQAKDIATGASLGDITPLALVIGVVSAAATGYFAIRFMLKLLEKTSLRAFAWYTLALGVLVLTDQLFFNIFFPPLF